MIEVSVEPSRLVAGRRSQLAIRFANTGRRTCSDIVFRLALPAGITLMSGTNRAEIQAIRPGSVYTHEVTVEPVRPGDFELTSTNFSYRDEFDMPVRVTDFRARLAVEIAEAPRPSSAGPPGRLGVEQVGGELALGEWDNLQILVRNTTGVPLSDVTVAVSGPFRTDGKRAKIAALSRGAAARFPFKVNAVEGGRHVPVSVHTTYSYLDGLGSVRTGRQGDGLEVAVMERGAPPQGASPVRTVLFLAASPKDMEPLRPDLELRMVDEQMQLDRNRDDFRLESHVAARLTDISRSLVRYKPHVVHFSGHGDAYGRLYVEDERGFSKPVNPEGLAKMFGLYKATIQCVVVNACHSIRLAEAMSEHIDYVVGMRSQVGDSAAILFSVGFYQALFGGENVPDAFKLACSLLQSDEETEREYQTPVLYPPGLG